jgi:protein-S-isoprenylcysteine O-methyltransferase Ste14
MSLPGLDNLRSRLPELRSDVAIAKVVGAVLAVFCLATLFFVTVDRVFAEWMPDGEILVLAFGFGLLSGFFSGRKSLQAKFQQHAYSRAFARFGIPGLGIIAAAIAHLAYMPGPPLPDVWWKSILVALGWFSLAVGALLWWRSVLTLGVDNLVMLYVYFPADSRIVNSRIYAVIRHPIYSAGLRVAGGFALIHANWYSLLVLPILWLFCIGWIMLVEEKELLNRFPGYAAYRQRLPAFWVRPRQVFGFFKFIIAGA